MAVNNNKNPEFDKWLQAFSDSAGDVISDAMHGIPDGVDQNYASACLIFAMLCGTSGAAAALYGRDEGRIVRNLAPMLAKAIRETLQAIDQQEVMH